MIHNSYISIKDAAMIHLIEGKKTSNLSHVSTTAMKRNNIFFNGIEVACHFFFVPNVYLYMYLTPNNADYL